eukprot:1485714-Lingulodinium_polyedra.AAC.1
MPCISTIICVTRDWKRRHVEAVNCWKRISKVSQIWENRRPSSMFGPLFRLKTASSSKQKSKTPMSLYAPIRSFLQPCDHSHQAIRFSCKEGLQMMAYTPDSPSPPWSMAQEALGHSLQL